MHGPFPELREEEKLGSTDRIDCRGISLPTSPFQVRDRDRGELRSLMDVLHQDQRIDLGFAKKWTNFVTDCFVASDAFLWKYVTPTSHHRWWPHHPIQGVLNTLATSS